MKQFLYEMWGSSIDGSYTDTVCVCCEELIAWDARVKRIRMYFLKSGPDGLLLGGFQWAIPPPPPVLLGADANAPA